MIDLRPYRYSLHYAMPYLLDKLFSTYTQSAKTFIITTMKNISDKSQASRANHPNNYAVEILGEQWSLLIIQDCLIANKKHRNAFSNV